MAIIKCPECEKEISDKAETCPNCGYPIAKSNTHITTNDNSKKSNAKIVKVIAGIVVVGIIGVVGYNYLILQPRKKAEQKAVYEKAMRLVEKEEYSDAIELLYTIPEYENIEDEISKIEQEKERSESYSEGIALLEKGKYLEGMEILETISDYSDVSIVLEEAKYESYAYSAVSAVKEILKNPDSLSVYDIYFYETKSNEESEIIELESESNESIDTDSTEIQPEQNQEDSYPYIVMYIGAQNGFGGNTTSYAGCSYEKESGKYVLDAYTQELDTEELDEDDDEYWFYSLSAILIQSKLDNGVEVGNINRERFDAVLRSSAYSAIKIIE